MCIPLQVLIVSNLRFVSNLSLNGGGSSVGLRVLEHPPGPKINLPANFLPGITGTVPEELA